jgi:hypothetical protein
MDQSSPCRFFLVHMYSMTEDTVRNAFDDSDPRSTICWPFCAKKDVVDQRPNKLLAEQLS